MERLDPINPDRIQWCCDDRGITPDELAHALSIGDQTMQRVMGGNGGLTFNQLRKVAKFFNRGVMFFVEEGAAPEQAIRSPQFRTLANQKPHLSPEVKTLIERVERQRKVFLDLREDMDESVPRFRGPDVTGHKPPEAAAAVRRWLKLKEQNSFAAFRTLVESKGIMVVLAVGYYGDWRLPEDASVTGFSIYYDQCPAILVKKQRSEGRQLFTLAHELGHLILHRSSFIDEEEDFYSRKGREREANVFAAHLLVPDDFLQQIDLDNKPSDPASIYDWLKPWRTRWGVSAEMILLRLIEARKITKSTLDGYLKWREGLSIPESEGGSRQYRHREPLHLFGDQYVRTVLDSYHSKQISLYKASTFLDNLKIPDVHRLEAHLASL